MEKPLPKTSIKEYYEKNNLTPIQNIDGCGRWMTNLSHEEQRLLFADNRTSMASHYGKATGRFQGFRNYHCWVFDKAGIMVSTAAERGTVIEARKGTPLNKIKSFVTELAGILKSVEDKAKNTPIQILQARQVVQIAVPGHKVLSLTHASSVK